MKFTRIWRSVAAAALVSSLLTACGGGGGDDDDDPQQPAGVSIGGVAATGAALEGATVSVKCASGAPVSGAATTGVDGSYSVTVVDGALPCIVRVTKDGTTLHSIVEQGAELPATANVTPLTELLTALVSGSSASALYADFNSSAQARLTAANVDSATDDLVESLAGIVDLSGDDLLKGELVAAVDGEGGNLQDQKLDAIALALEESGTTLAELSAAVTGAPGVPPPALADVPVAAAACPALRSGPYWGIEPDDPEFSIAGAPFVVNAADLTLTFTENGVSESVDLTPVANQACRFTIPANDGGVEEIVVSRSAIGATRFREDGTFKTALIFPAQTLALSELAGDWNYVGYAKDGDGIESFNGRATIAANGNVTNIEDYVGLVGPDLETSSIRLVAQSDGTFLEEENGSANGVRYYAHRAPNGVLTLFAIGIDGGVPGIAVLRKQEPVVVRPAGAVINFWDIFVNPFGAGLIRDFSLTITEVNTAATPKTETRLRAGDNRVDTRAIDFPRVGLLYRAPNACTTGEGGPAVNCLESMALGSQGTGFNVASGGSGTEGFFDISVIKP